MITSESSEWVLLSAIYHHVLKQSPSTERAKIEITSARKSGQLRLRSEQTRVHLAGPEALRNVEPTTALAQLIPDGNYRTDFERSYATRREATSKTIFEYINIVGHRDDVLALWPPNTKDPVAHVVEPPAVDPFRTGAPGRPTSADAIYTEAERRISSGEVVPQPRGRPLRLVGSRAAEILPARARDEGGHHRKQSSRSLAEIPGEDVAAVTPRTIPF
jgi:hypothetical protein